MSTTNLATGDYIEQLSEPNRPFYGPAGNNISFSSITNVTDSLNWAHDSYMSNIHVAPYFGVLVKCHYCLEESTDNLSILSIVICKQCLLKVLDYVLKPKNLNRKIVEAVKLMN